MADSTAATKFVARQPVFDRDLQVLGYELLFRAGPENFFSHHDVDIACSSVINDSLAVFGLETLLSGKKAFVNCTRKVLVQGLVTVLPSDRTIVEILETIEPDAEVLAACRALKQAGYVLALDDFVCRPELEPLASLADILKIDFLMTRGPEREEMTRRFGARARLLAEKVETREEFQEAVRLGYSYFQGYFFCRPEMITGREIPGFKLSYLRFLHEVHRPDIDFARIEEVIRHEVSLSVSLLRFLNSAAFAFRTEITSIRQALVLLGERAVRTWASLLALAGMGQDKPPELVITSLVRARFCELIGPFAGLEGRQPDLFLMGLLSLIDALVDRPLEDVLNGLPISQSVKSSLTGGESTMAPLLALVRAVERGDWALCAELASASKLAEPRIADVYNSSIEWAHQIFRLAR